MRPMSARIAKFAARKPGTRPRGARGKHMRVPRRAYPLWRRARVRAACACALGLAVGAWLWTGGYLQAARASAETWAGRELASLGFTVQKITVSGREEIPVEAILGALQIARGQSVFDLDTRSAKLRIEALGWVDTAAVSRYWPDTIHIDLVERRPFALWQQGRKLTVIDRGGAVITRHNVARFASLPVVVGPGSRFAAAQLIDILITEPGLFGRVRAATRVGERRWDLHIDNGVVIRLPADNETVAWQRLALLEQNYQILSRDIKTIDLRLSDRLIVRMTRAGMQRINDPGEQA